MMKKWVNLLFVSAIAIMPIGNSIAKTASTEGQLTLSYSNGKQPTQGLKQVNEVLKTVGVRVSNVTLPEESKPILEISKERALTKEESEKLISHFYMDRSDLLKEIKNAGREPEVHRGGFLSTSELEVAPYPKVYDMKAMTPEVKHYLQEKFGKLHVNSSDNGEGIDEVMTIVSGGPWTWFFALPDNVVGKLTLGEVPTNGKAWRISYPGLGPHGGFFDAKYGLVVAFAHGPEHFVMRYEEPTVKAKALLGTNPWIDLSGKTPKLIDKFK